MRTTGQQSKCPFSSGMRPSAAAPDAIPKVVTPGPTDLVSFDTHINPLEFLGGLIDRYGDVVRYQTRFGPCFLFVNPEHVQTILHRESYRRASLVKMMLGEGLLASDGSFWKSQRRLMQKDFLPARIKPFVSIMTQEADRTAADWAAAAQRGDTVDVSTAMTRLTLSIIVRSLFSEDLSEERATELCGAITQTLNDLSNISWTIFGVPARFAPGSNAGFAASKKIIDTISYDMIERRRAMPVADRPADLLTLLIDAAADGAQLTDKQLRDEIVSMLVGGHETTALALSWAWKLIAEHPSAETRLHQEVDTVLKGRTPEIDDLPNLPWAQAIFQETIRLYPPVWYMARVASEDDEIAGHPIPRGACILVSAWFTHRHKAFWTAPELFDPTRFVDSAVPLSHRYAHFPFGGGRHQCLGMHFALMEGALVLAQLAQRFSIRPIDGSQVRPDPGITLRQSPFMKAQVTLRSIPQAQSLAPRGAA